MLATNMFFWDWINAPVPSVEEVVVVPPFVGKSGARGDDYYPLPDEYWADREGRMTQDYKTGREIFEDKPVMVSPTPFNQSGIAGVMETGYNGPPRNVLVAALRDAENVDSLRAIAARIRKISK